MKIHENEPIVLEKSTKKGSIGCVIVLIVMALAILLFCFFGVMGMIHVKGSPSRWQFLICLPFGLILLWVAKWGYFSLHLSRIVLNRKNRTLTEVWESATNKKRETVRDWDDFSKILLIKKVSGSSSGGQDTGYVISIASSDIKDTPRYIQENSQDKKFIELKSYPNDYWTAREFAEQIARYCDFPLEDRSEGDEALVRKPDELDKSLRQKAKTAGETSKLENIPPDLASIFRRQGDEIVIDFPPYKMRIGCLMPISFICLLVIMFGETFFDLFMSHQSGLPSNKFSLYFYGGLTFFPIFLIAFAIIFVTGRRQRIIIGKKTIRHEMYRVLPRKTISMQRDDIEEIVISRGTLMNPPAILIRGDKGQIELGNMEISEKERAFIRNFLQSALSL